MILPLQTFNIKWSKQTRFWLILFYGHRKFDKKFVSLLNFENHGNRDHRHRYSSYLRIVYQKCVFNLEFKCNKLKKSNICDSDHLKKILPIFTITIQRYACNGLPVSKTKLSNYELVYQ